MSHIMCLQSIVKSWRFNIIYLLLVRVLMVYLKLVESHMCCLKVMDVVHSTIQDKMNRLYVFHPVEKYFPDLLRLKSTLK
jgi:hypothetical protein